MRLMNLNLCAEDATTVTVSSEDTNFPASNLKHPFRSKRWRSTDVSSEWIVFDFQTIEDVDSVILLWSKEDGVQLSGSATLKIQANATNVWTSPAVDQTLTINDTYEIASHYFTTAQSYRYWRVVLQDAGNPNGFLELGVAWIGKSLQIENAQNGFDFTVTDRSKSVVTDFGHIYTDEYPLFSSLNFSYANLYYEAIQILENAFRENGNRKPVFIAVDPEDEVFDKDHFAIYGRFQSNTFGSEHVNYNIFNAKGLTVVELS